MSLLRFFVAVSLLAGLGTQRCSAGDDEKAPAKFVVEVDTSKGKFKIQVYRKWAPNGADHFYTLVKNEFYNDCRFFRVVPGFIVQWGINGDPDVQKKWEEETIKDDSVVASNMRGFVTYAQTASINSRSTQLFINFADNPKLDASRFAPFGRVIEGMEVVDKINAEYAEKPDQTKMQEKGNEYLKEEFPNLDYIKSITLAKPAR